MSIKYNKRNIKGVDCTTNVLEETTGVLTVEGAILSI